MNRKFFYVFLSSIVGTFFILTGFLKALDSYGFYQLIKSYGWNNLAYIAPLISGLEIVVGIILLLRIEIRKTALFALMLTSFFTVTYAYGLVYKGIENCGCFGVYSENFSPTVTFLKNILLAVFCFLLYYKDDFYFSTKVNRLKLMSLYLGSALAFCLSGFTLSQPILTNDLSSLEQTKIGQILAFEKLSDTISVERYGLFIFNPNCSHCWNATANVKDMVDSAYLDRVIGVVAESQNNKLSSYKKLFNPNFSIIQISDTEFKQFLIGKIPHLIIVEKNTVKKILSGEIPSYQILKRKKYRMDVQITTNIKSLIEDKKKQFDLFLKSVLKNNNIPEEYVYQDEFSPDFYLVYPYLFSDAFGLQPSKQLDDLCIAGTLIYKSILIIDNIIDEPERLKRSKISEILLINQIYQEEAIKILTNLFGKDSVFWNFWRKRRMEYAFAVKEERIFNKNTTLKKYEKVAEKKAAFGKIAIDACHLLSGQRKEQVYENLLESHKKFSIALQLSDDIQDIKEDIAYKQFNWSLNILKQQLVRDKIDVEALTSDKIEKYLYISGVAASNYELSLNYLTKAKCLVSSDALGWLSIMSEIEKGIKNTLNALSEYLAIFNKKTKLMGYDSNLKINNIKFTAINTPLKKVLTESFEYVHHNLQKGYGELKHIMYLGRKEGFDREIPIQVGDVFQRAIITDIFVDLLHSFPNKELEKVIDGEIKYLLKNRRKKGVGGWSYYPEVMEIAPDADDLGQIIQCLARTDNKEAIAKYCLPLLSILFECNTPKNDGSFETWIVPEKNRTPFQEKQHYYNTTKWGRGPDNEVVANLLYGLAVYDSSKFQERILNGCRYLATRQDPSGYWKSRWYYGKFYCTYLCMKLFKMVKVHRKETSLAIKFVKSTQNEDGGWGYQDRSDSLNTSLAMLAVVDYDFAGKTTLLENGLKYLYSMQDKERKNWEAVPFIIPRLGRPYSSTTLTTAYVMKSLVSIYQNNKN